MVITSSASKQIKVPVGTNIYENINVQTQLLTQATTSKSLEIKNTLEHINDRPPLFKPPTSSNDSSYDESASEEATQQVKNKIKKKSRNKQIQKKASCHQYFTTIKMDGKLYDKCTIVDKNGIQCKAQYVQHGSTSRMNEHLKKDHDLNEFKARESKSKNNLITDKAKLLVYFVVSTASPFSIVENDFFRELVSESIEIPSRKIIKDQLLKVYEEMFVLIASELKKIEFMALTTDGWTSKHQKICFNSCTIHYLNEILEWKTINLGIHQSKGHDANLTTVGLKNKLNNFKIFDKIKYIAVDNASVMRNTCKNLNKEFIGCLNHLLNLIVKRFFNAKIIKDKDTDSEDEDQNDEDDIFLDEVGNIDIEPIESDDDYSYSEEYTKALKTVGKILKKIKIIVKLFSKSIPLREQLIELSGKTLINDIKIRWNYTLLMIERYLENYNHVLTLITNSPTHNKSHSKYFLQADDILVVQCLTTLLKPFHNVTEILSGEKYSTIDLVLNSVLYIRHKINSVTFKNSIEINLKNLLIDSFNFYIQKYEVLDNKIYMAAAVLSSKFKVCSYASDTEKINFQNEGENYIKDLWKKINNNDEKLSEATPSSKSSCNSFFGKDFDEEKKTDSSIEKELSLLRLDTSNAVLKEFWLTRKSYYPCLFKVFRYIMCLPATSVPSERLFKL